MNVLIAGEGFSLPDGLAPTSRVRCYCRGLASSGATVRVLITAPSFRPGEEPDWASEAGEITGGTFRYVDGTPTESRSFAVRQIRKVVRPLRFLRLVRHAHRQLGGIDIVHYYGDSTWWLLWCVIGAAMGGARSSLELCEIPKVNRPVDIWWDTSRWVFKRFAVRRCDYVVAISSMLEKWAAEFCRRDAVVIRMPVLVDGAIIADSAAREPVSGRVGYCGNLEQRAEAQGLLRSFQRVLAERPNSTLVITGSAGRGESWGSPAEYARSLGIDSSVRFLGLLPRTDLPGFYQSAAVLALPRRRGASSAASVPTKLAEYLLSGRPVVASAVGEIPRYLKDGENAYLAPEEDEGAFAARLSYALSHREEADSVGSRGRETALREFECVRACRTMLDAWKAKR